MTVSTSSRRMLDHAIAHPALAVTTGYVLLRALDLVGFALVGGDGSRSLGDTLTTWDGGWYVRAARIGWPEHVDIAVDGTPPGQTTWAWPPLFPLAGRILAAPFGAGAVPAALTVVAMVSGLLAALVLSRAVRPFAGVAGGIGVALLWASMPAAPVLLMSYTEASFCLLAFAALWAAARERFLLAGAVLVAAGLVRNSALPFAVALAAAAWMSWRGRTATRLSTPRLVAVALLAVASVVTWPLVVALRAGSWDGLARVHAAWGRATTPLHDTAAWFWHLDRQGLPEVALVLVVLAAATIAAVACWRDSRYPLSVRLIGPVSVLFLLATGVGTSGLRLLLPDVAIPAWLQPLVRSATAVVVACVVLLALRWAWIGVYVGGSPDSPPP